MIRIRTKITDDNRVLTLYSDGEWVTLYTINGKSNSVAAEFLLDAGHNHLDACKLVQSTIKNDGGTT